MRAPFRVAFFPLRLVGNGLSSAADVIGPRYFDPKPKHAPRSGPVVTPRVTIGAVNDIGLGPAVTWMGFPIADARLSASGTWSAIDRRRVHLSETFGYLHPVSFRLRADYDYKPTRRYFGIGNETPRADKSHYLLESSSTEGALLLGASPLRQLRIAGGTSSMSERRGYGAYPLLESVFPPASVPFIHRTTREVWYGVAADVAALDDARDPSRGIHGRADLRRMAGMRSADPDYDQWLLEGRAYLPVFAKRRVIAVRGVYSGVDPRGGATTPFYRLAESEDATRFAGYPSGRFHDRQLALARIEYRWQVLYRISAVALYEKEEVAPSASSFRFGRAHESYGGGLRVGVSNQSILRFEVAKSVEGVQTVLTLGGDF